MPNQFNSPEGDLENYFITEYWLIDQYVGDTLWIWGGNTRSEIGDNTTLRKITPVTTFAGGTDWKQVSCGGRITAAIKTDGTLWVWGAGGDGAIGDNTTNNKPTPVTTFAGGTNWKQVSIGSFHTAAIKTDGTLWTWGRNSSGQLGNGGTVSIRTPGTTSAGGTDWKQVSCGGYSTAAIKTDGTLWMWGRNTIGQLGDNTTTQKNVPITTFAGGTNWKQVACGDLHTGAIKNDGTLWTWGFNNSGHLGINDFTSRSTPVTTFAVGTDWKQVSCGGRHTVAIKTDGTLWAWGTNYNGPLGDNTFTDKITPVTTFAGGTNWKQLSCGYRHTAAIKTDGTLWIWGRNTDNGLPAITGMLGDNTFTNKITPVTTFAGGTNWKQVSGGNFHTSAVTSGTDPTFFIS